jgi:DNA-binding NtrC family response regulator
MKYNIMFVDDHNGVLESLRWIFMDEPYEFCAFDRPTEALRAIETKECAVVVTDQSMPEMAGIEFLRVVKERSPNTVGMIMTAFVDFDVALDALGHGLVYRFVTKPWDKDDLKQAVRMAIAHYELNSRCRKQLY